MEDSRSAAPRQYQRRTEPEELIGLTKKALEEAVEKERINHADLLSDWTDRPGLTLDLSSRGADVLPVEVIELIRDRVERWDKRNTAVPQRLLTTCQACNFPQCSDRCPSRDCPVLAASISQSSVE